MNLTDDQPAVYKLEKQKLVTTLNFPFIFDSMNTLLRKNRWKGRERKEGYIWLLRSMTTNVHSDRVRLEYVRNSSASRRMDYDNLVGSAKEIIDAIVRSGILPEDNPNVIAERQYEHVLISRKIQPFTVIRIIDL